MNLSDGFHVERVGNTLVVELGGRIGSLGSPRLIQQRRELVEEIQQSNTTAVVVDFSRVEYFGSLVLDTLCVVWKHLKEREGEMFLCSLSDIAQDIFDKSRLGSLWPVYASRHDALQASHYEDLRCVNSNADSQLFLSHVDDAPSRLHVMQTGPHTVIGFSGGNLPPEHVVSRYLDEIKRLIEEHNCQELTVDMQGISHVPSGFLGVVTEILKTGVVLSLQNPSVEIREVFEICNLDRSVRICDVE